MKPIGRVALTAMVAVALLFVADRILQPLPVAAATAVAGGLLVLWTSHEPRPPWVALGLVTGALVGVVFHLFVHRSGQSPPPQSGLVLHLALDGVTALGVALPVLLAAGLADRSTRT